MLGTLKRIFRLDLRRSRDVTRDVDQEIAFHLDERTDALIARGWEPEAARAEALRRFGADDSIRPTLVRSAVERERRLTVWELFDAVRTDLRIAVRQLRRSIPFSIATIAVLALAIGSAARCSRSTVWCSSIDSR